MSLKPGDKAFFLRMAIDELIALKAGREGDGIIDVLDGDLFSTPELKPVHDGYWVECPAGRYRVVGIYRRYFNDGEEFKGAAIIETVFEGPVPS